MFPNYYFRMPMYQMMNNPIGENVMMGLPAEDEDFREAQDVPMTGFGTGAPDFEFEAGPSVQDDINYTQGYLRTKIGSYVKIEFLIGTNLFIDREGILQKVGISYVVIREAGTGNELMCDIYSIKFVEFYDNNNTNSPNSPKKR
ncbi:hypothetical protein [Maledivibacter halophilus]|uniref:Uncharacterized protein n=1 Tax=Maledivibacter halophilus TaxID=36842 RepID=A0A1T5KDC5_9FIRM|nr:hypothetical protein [Maledivibacter halophilus]SKC61620.1 hypothetical protein SAMN02194393_01699 [Maledivibacter halophilus]